MLLLGPYAGVLADRYRKRVILLWAQSAMGLIGLLVGILVLTGTAQLWLGSLAVPNPNHFDGDVRLFALGADDWVTLPVSAGYIGSGRGYGIADLAATPPGEEPRAGGALAYHVLEIMESLLDSAHTRQAVAIRSAAERPPAVALADLASSGRPVLSGSASIRE